MSLYVEYLEAEKLPKDRVKAQRVTTKAANYQVVRETFYRIEKFSSWLRCVGLEEASRIIKEVH